MVTALLAGGADPDVVEPHFGRTPLHYAALSGSLEVAAALLDGGADADVADLGTRAQLFNNSVVARRL